MPAGGRPGGEGTPDDGARQPWRLPDDPAARLRIAKGYPYDAPGGSYLFRDGKVHPIDGADLTGRVAVLAHGSNRAPAQLARKFAAFSGDASEIPVTHVWLHDYDVVYSAHITTYGSVASTLQAAPGCRARVALTWLDPAQLRRMHETEGNYLYGHLHGVRVEPVDGLGVDGAAITMYLSHHGCLADGVGPLGLSAVEAAGRPHGAAAQEAVLELLRQRLAPKRALDDFILENISDAALRAERLARLRAEAIAASVPDFVPICDAGRAISSVGEEED